MARPRTPRTPSEWQEAANLARAALLIHAAQAYGLVSGGPEIVAWRCDVILTRAERLGIKPDEDVALKMAVQLSICRTR